MILYIHDGNGGGQPTVIVEPMDEDRVFQYVDSFRPHTLELGEDGKVVTIIPKSLEPEIRGQIADAFATLRI